MAYGRLQFLFFFGFGMIQNIKIDFQIQ